MSAYKKTTVVFPIRDGSILLGMKKRGFGAGWWNGFGGKLEPGETYTASATRETREEVELIIEESVLQHAADIVFRFNGNVNIVTRAYLARTFAGTPVETEEMCPKWFALDHIPYDTMWPGDNYWIPNVLDTAAALPLGFIIDFTGDNRFVDIEQASPKVIEEYF